MISEQLSPTAVKISLTAEETAELPTSRSREPLRRYIRSLANKIRLEGTLSLPEGKLLAEIYMVNDGSSVIFISVIEPRYSTDRLYACELSGIENLRGLVNALADSGVKCSVYCGHEPQDYRVIFNDPPPQLRHICSEYGDYCEVSRLFAAQTAEYLTTIAEDLSAAALKRLLS